MSFDGRRLDESNWRPRSVPTALAVTFGAAVTFGLAFVADAIEPAAVAAVSGLCLWGAVRATAARERRGGTVLASVLAAVSGLALLSALGLAVVVQLGWPPSPPLDSLDIAPFVLVLAGASGGFGAPAAFWGVTPSDGIGTAAVRLFGVVSVPAAALVAAFLSPPFDPVIGTVRFGFDLALARGPAGEPILVDGAAIPRFGGLFALVAVAALALGVALGRLPLAELAAEHSRGTIDAAVGRLRGWLRIVLAFATLFAIGGVVAQPVTPELYAYVPPDTVAAGIELTLSTTIRWALLSVAVVSAPAIVVPRLARAAASDRFRPNLLPLMPFVVGGAIVVAATGVHATVEATALERAATPESRQLLRGVFDGIGSLVITLGVAVLGVSITIALLTTVKIAGVFGFFGSAMGAQMLSAGVFLAAVAAASADAPAVAVIAGVAACVLVWDLGEFAATLACEIGRAGAGLGSEFVHAIGAVVLAVGSVAVGVATMRAVGVVPSIPEPVALLATVSVVLGTLLLFVVSR